MIKPELNVNDYIRILKKRKYIILLTVAAVTIFTYVFGLLRPVAFRTQVTLTFHYNKTISNVVNEVAFNMPTNLANMAELVTRTAVLEAAAVRMGILKPGAPVERRDAVVESLKSKIATSVQSNSEILAISVRSADPIEAADIANNVAEAFRVDVGRRNSEEIRKARLFIETQRGDATQKLQAVEDELERFRAEHGIVDISVELGHRLLLVNKLQENRAELEAQRSTLERRLRAFAESRGVDRRELERSLKTPTADALRQSIIDEEVRAVALASRVREDHPTAIAARERIRSLRAGLVDMLRDSYDRELASVRIEIEMIAAKAEAYRLVSEEFERSLAEMPRRRARLERLEQNAAIHRDMIRSYNKKLEEIGVVEAEKSSQTPDIVNRALIPTVPVAGTGLMLSLLGVAGGTVLGLFLAFFIETVDVSVSTVEEVEEYLQVPVLGMLPFLSFRDKADPGEGDGSSVSHRCIAYYKPRSNLAEAFRIVRTNLRFKTLGNRDARTILVTSSLSGEGKTFVAANLAIIYAQLGARVLLMDCNLRDPDIHNHFGVPKNPGITDILIGDYRIDQTIRETPIKNLSLLTSGPIPPNPSELIETEEFRALLGGLEGKFDLIVADSPPLLPVADATILTTVFRRTIIVHNAIRTGLMVLHRSKATIEGAGSHLDGIILNQLQSTLFMDANLQVNYYYHKKEQAPE